ncbi:MAG: UDP-3-O-acyl-N-acetylglucosamine deacetylase, partial [Flavobacteriales bacterium]
MIDSTKQHTLKSKITFKGVGLHTGKMCTLTVQPAAAHHGYKFQRTDLEGQPIV